QSNTLERVYWKKWFSRYKWATVVDEQIDYDNYLDQIKQHQFVLCPCGNGKSCYRELEVIYSGSIPVMERDKYNEQWEVLGMPAIFVDDFREINDISFLLDRIPKNTSTELVNLDYWKGLIRA